MILRTCVRFINIRFSFYFFGLTTFLGRLHLVYMYIFRIYYLVVRFCARSTDHHYPLRNKTRLCARCSHVCRLMFGYCAYFRVIGNNHVFEKRKQIAVVRREPNAKE